MMLKGLYVSLNDFASRNQLNNIIAENMINVPMLQEGVSSFEEKAYFCFYKAYQICYDLVFNGIPYKWKIPDYLKQCRYGSNNKDLVTVMQSVTMSIVVVLLEHCNFPPSHPIIEVIDAIKNAIKGMFIHGENDGFISAEIIQSFRPTECIKVSRTIQRGTNIDCKIDTIEFGFVSNKSIDEFFQNKIEEAIKKAVDEIPVLNAEVKDRTLYLRQVPRKEIDAQKTTSQKSAPNDNLQQQLADAQKTKNEDKGVLPIVGHKTPHRKGLTWEEKKQCFKNAVLNVMKREKHDGEYLFEKNTHWKAIYRFAVDSGIMYDLNDPKEPQDKSDPQYAVFEKFAQDQKFHENPPTRLPFTKSAINDISKKNYVRYNSPYPWLKDGLYSEDGRSIALYIELEDVYKALQEEYDKFVSQAEKSDD